MTQCLKVTIRLLLAFVHELTIVKYVIALTKLFSSHVAYNFMVYVSGGPARQYTTNY